MKVLSVFLCLIVVLSTAPAYATISYVRASANGANNGTSWANAYTSLANALGSAGDTIWVANGTYQTTGPGGFRIWAYQKLFGGFVGTETQLSQRNFSSFQTVLDGNYNSRQVVRVQNVIDLITNIPNNYTTPIDVRLDGFKVMKGVDTLFSNTYGNFPSGQLFAGGICIFSSSYPTDRVAIANCLIVDNHGGAGGGIWLNSSGQTTVTNCRIENNSAWFGGGVLHFQQGVHYISSTDSALHIISDCVFSNNRAKYGGAVHSGDGRVVNSTSKGFFRTDSTPTVFTRCIFRGNTATVAGGAISDSVHGRMRFYNCVFAGNYAPQGAALYRSPATVGASAFPTTLVHCTVAGNRSTSMATTDYPVTAYGGDTIRNCIFWDNVSGSGQHVSPPRAGSWTVIMSNNIMQGGGGTAGGMNTYSFNPLFVLPGSSAAAPFPLSGSYDYHLRLASAAIDTGMLGIPAQGAVHSTDLDGNARLFALKPDLGAYEKTYCSTTKPVITPLPATVCMPDSTLLSVNGPFHYWNGAGTSSYNLWAKNGGTYHVIRAIDSTGCRSKTSFPVTAYTKPSATITRTNNLLSISPVYASYQWHKGGVAIAGATTANYTATTNGVYKLVVLYNPGGCKDSATYNLNNLSIKGTGVIESFSIYPNPVQQGKAIVTLKANKALDVVAITVISITGQQILHRQYRNIGSTFEQELNLSDVAKGIYFVRVAANGYLSTGKLAVE